MTMPIKTLAVVAAGTVLATSAFAQSARLSSPLSSVFQREDKTMRAVKLTSSIAAVFTAIALGTAAGHANELEQVNTVFEHAIPNIAGKSLIARVVTYPPRRQDTVPSPCQVSLHLRSCAVRYHSQPG